MAEKQVIDIESKQYYLIKKIIKQRIANKTVWAYGSRVDGTSNRYSDLDLVVFGVDFLKLEDLKEDFAESDLPFSVDVMSWEEIPENFKKNIERNYVVL